MSSSDGKYGANAPPLYPSNSYQQQYPMQSTNPPPAGENGPAQQQNVGYSQPAQQQNVGYSQPAQQQNVGYSQPAQQQIAGYSQLSSGEASGKKEEKRDDDTPGSGLESIPKNYMNLDFDQCFTEHESTRTIPVVYKYIGLLYKYTKVIVYHIFVLMFGVPFVLFWAVTNGITVFTVVWLWGPILKVTSMMIYAFAPIIATSMEVTLKPFMDVSARLFRQIRIRGDFSGKLSGIGDHTA